MKSSGQSPSIFTAWPRRKAGFPAWRQGYDADEIRCFQHEKTQFLLLRRGRQVLVIAYRGAEQLSDRIDIILKKLGNIS